MTYFVRYLEDRTAVWPAPESKAPVHLYDLGGYHVFACDDATLWPEQDPSIGFSTVDQKDILREKLTLPYAILEALDLAPPIEVHMAYFRAALASLGKLDAVEEVVSKDPIQAQLWGWATSISSDDKAVKAVASALSIDLKAVFAKALEIKNSRGR